MKLKQHQKYLLIFAIGSMFGYIITYNMLTYSHQYSVEEAFDYGVYVGKHFNQTNQSSDSLFLTVNQDSL